MNCNFMIFYFSRSWNAIEVTMKPKWRTIYHKMQKQYYSDKKDLLRLIESLTVFKFMEKNP
jgi:hypothetical protein